MYDIVKPDTDAFMQSGKTYNIALNNFLYARISSQQLIQTLIILKTLQALRVRNPRLNADLC